MLRQAEQLEKTGVTKVCSSGYGAGAQGTDAGETSRTKSTVDELVDCVAELTKLESLKSWCRRYCADA